MKRNGWNESIHLVFLLFKRELATINTVIADLRAALQG